MKKSLIALSIIMPLTACSNISSIIKRYENQKIIATYIGKDTMIVRSEDKSAEFLVKRNAGYNCILRLNDKVLFNEDCDETVERVVLDDKFFDRKPGSDYFQSLDEEFDLYRKALRLDMAIKQWKQSKHYFDKYLPDWLKLKEVDLNKILRRFFSLYIDNN